MAYPLAGHVRSPKFGRFRRNEQVRVVTRSFIQLGVTGAPFVSAAALSQDSCIISKSALEMRPLSETRPYRQAATARPIATHKVAYKDRSSKDGTVRCNRPAFPHCTLSATRVLFAERMHIVIVRTRCPHKVSPIILSAKSSTPSHPIPAYPVPIAYPCFISSATHLQNQSTA